MEYKIITAQLPHDLSNRMNSLAQHGWEALTVFPKAGILVAVMHRIGE